MKNQNIIIITTFLIVTLTMDIALSAKYYDPVAPIPITDRNDKPTFIPCEVVNGLLGTTKFVPCSMIRGIKYFRDHYKRGLRMLMKNNRKALSRNKYLNSIGNRAKKQVAQTIANKITNLKF